MKIKDTSFTRNDIISIYEKWKNKAIASFEKGSYDKCIENIIIAARWMYNFNMIYYDKCLETLISQTSNSLFGKIHFDETNPRCVCFLDSIGSISCLDLQYLRGLIDLNKEIIYILHTNQSKCGPIIEELKKYKKAHIHLISGKNRIETAKEIRSIIERYRPSDILMHMIPQDVISLLSVSNINGTKIYNIDLQDHTFWLGSSIADYDIVFRSYGEKIALEKRCFKPKQIIRLPYYPIIKQNTPFVGFPKLPDNAIIVFTGGAQYKMLGKHDIFFRLMDTVLDCSDKVHILVATIADNVLFSQKVDKMRNKGRIHLIGMRKDINEVFKNSDIYLSTYPFMGGLMTQYAAANGLPIIAYAEEGEANLVEEMVNHKNKSVRSQYSLESFKSYATKIITDLEFRRKEGDSNQNAIINENEFAKYLGLALSQQQTNISWLNDVQPDYEKMIEFYIQNENYSIHPGLKSMIQNLRWKVFFYFPFNAITIIQCIIRWLKTRS